MTPFLTGAAAGLLAGLLIGGAGAGLAYARMLAARERSREVARLAELGTLTGGLAHEIKNPLSTVQLNLQLLSEDLHADAATGRRVLNRMQTVVREAARLREILDDFLRYAGRIELERRPTDLSQLLAEVADFVSPQAPIGRVRLRVKPSPPVMADIDPRLVKQALLNLILNAIQILAAGPAGGEVIVGAATEPGGAQIDVTDTGPGIAPEDQPKVFDAYFSKRSGGTGLGLAMTRRIALEHGGSVELRSELGKGSSFILHLPAEPSGL